MLFIYCEKLFGKNQTEESCNILNDYLESSIAKNEKKPNNPKSPIRPKKEGLLVAIHKGVPKSPINPINPI
jgi:hypothetical protein